MRTELAALPVRRPKPEVIRGSRFLGSPSPCSSAEKMPSWDLLITDALVFDGLGAPPRSVDVAVKDGRVAAVGLKLDPSEATEHVSAPGQWLMPGLWDIHTHYDLEVELDPTLKESVRHGTTTVVFGNCSLGLAYGHQRDGEQDPIVDCFARVENIPKPILEAVADRASWSSSGDYLDHLETLRLGPNVAALLPHSMLRVQVMGLKASITRQPTPDELGRMERLVDSAMEEGFVGLSTDALPFHYLANDPHRRSKIPTQYMRFSELRRLTEVVRRWGRVWQATPAKNDPLLILRDFALTSGRLFGRPLKVTAVAALDLHTNRSLAVLGRVLSRVFNSRALSGFFRLQALAAPFETWAQGPITPLSEEVEELRALNEPDLEDRDARRAVLKDPEFRDRFVRMWTRGRTGFGLARLLRWLRREDVALTRRLEDMVVHSSPIPSWAGTSLREVFERARSWQSGLRENIDPKESEIFAGAPPLDGPYVGADAHFLLHLFETLDTELWWKTVTANRDPKQVERLLTHPLMLPGFADSGAHLTNMAFHDAGLRGLKLLAQRGLDAVARHVHRSSKAPAELFGIGGVGSLEVGMQADLLLLDPERLASWNDAESVRQIQCEVYAHPRLVNRSDGVVRGVWIRGARAWDGKDFAPELGARPMGRCLRAGREGVPKVRNIREQTLPEARQGGFVSTVAAP